MDGTQRFTDRMVADDGLDSVTGLLWCKSVSPDPPARAGRYMHGGNFLGRGPDSVSTFLASFSRQPIFIKS